MNLLIQNSNNKEAEQDHFFLVVVLVTWYNKEKDFQHFLLSCIQNQLSGLKDRLIVHAVNC